MSIAFMRARPALALNWGFALFAGCNLVLAPFGANLVSEVTALAFAIAGSANVIVDYLAAVEPEPFYDRYAHGDAELVSAVAEPSPVEVVHEVRATSTAVPFDPFDGAGSFEIDLAQQLSDAMFAARSRSPAGRPDSETFSIRGLYTLN